MEGGKKTLFDALFEASSDITACEPEDAGVVGRDGVIIAPMLSLMASAIRTDLLRSSSLIDEFLDSPVSGSSSSAKPAAYISIASSTVIPPALDCGREWASTVTSVMEVPFVTMLLRSVPVVSIWLDDVVSAERKLDLTSSLLYSACQGRCGTCGRSLNVEKGKAPSNLVSLVLGFLLPVGRDIDSPPAVAGLDS